MNLKDIRLNPIKRGIANEFIKKWHYSGKIVNNSQLHFGAFYDKILHGVLSLGPSLDKSKIIGLVKDTGWNEFIELNRMAFDNFLPKNSESRCISIVLKLIKKHYKHIKWIISFADATQCGDGTIYRASGFYLTGISSGSMWRLPENLWDLNNGKIAHRLKVQDKCSLLSKYILSKTKGKNLSMKKYVETFGGELLPGYQLRYIFFIDKAYKDKLNTPILPFSKIKEIGATMYKGKRPSGVIGNTPPIQGGDNSSNLIEGLF